MTISLRKVCVHNLKSINLDIPQNQLIAFCGLSGSGKSSLAFDTLYAEGQRRYIETFSAYTRQFLEKMERPEAERIEGIPPAVAITSRPQIQISRSTVGTATETSDYLRLLYSQIGKVYCQSCGREVRRDSPDSILQAIHKLPGGSKIIIAFSPSLESMKTNKKEIFEAEWREAGFLRGIVSGKSFRLDEGGIPLKEYGDARLLFLADLPTTDEEICEETGQNKEIDSFADSNSMFDDSLKDYSDQDITESESLIDSVKNDPLFDGSENFETEFTHLTHSEVAETIIDSDASEFEDESGDLSKGEPVNSLEQELEVKMAKRLLTVDPEGDAFLDDYLQKRNEMLKPGGPPQLFFIVDRITVGTTSADRIRESLETALAYGESQCWIFFQGDSFPQTHIDLENNESSCCHSNNPLPERFGQSYSIDNQDWTLVGFSRNHRCEDCGIEYPEPQPKLFSFNSPLGACPICEGFGNLMVLDLDLIVPNKKRSIRNDAIAPWTGAAYQYKLQELLGIADQLGVRVDVPFSELTSKEVDLLLNGSPKLNYDGLNGFFIRLQKQKYKMHIRVFLSRWRSYRVCPFCQGTRLRPESLAVRLENQNIYELSSMRISHLLEVIEQWKLSSYETEIGSIALNQLKNRLFYLNQVGLGYLTLDRAMRTLSSGEQRRVSLTSVLGSSLVDMLYVLDEPSIGLHPKDINQLLQSILKLRDRRNTVVVVEHEPTILEAADRIIEIGPEAGQNGGQIVFDGTVDEIKKSEKSLTGSYLSGKRTGGSSTKRRILEHGFIELIGARGYNLKNVNAVFPLGVLCLVTGVSGAGKSSLVQETLYPAICKKLGKENVQGLPYDKILGVEQIDDVVLIDQSPIGRSPRSNPVTYLKIFDDIRILFAETPEAKANLYNAGYFSFNVDGGRCNTCKGEGFIAIDMQFMADMFVKCPQCNGKRYQREILDILYRGKNIAEILDMTVREAFAFFRGQSKIQQKLKRLIDIGLDYIRLGQPANTLSGGESQRLKLAAYLSNSKKGRCLFILDESTTGLHFADIVQLLDDFDALVETGNSLIVVEHNLQMIKSADYIIDLGPGAGEEGGEIIAEGTPEQIARCPVSATGQFLAQALK
ncbi:MAG: excinuclease ABC subunit UvrA [Planctomycetia bacterium]|nr:excinuclease ABC subunit UvrA [Planctomycetia bacterium]